MMNYTQRGVGQGHMTIFLNFGTLYLTLEQVKLSISNVLHILTIVLYYSPYDKLPQREVIMVT